MDHFENKINETVTLSNLVEQVDEEMELLENAQALLGPGDDKFCTYLQGYVNRQALYSCKTCSIASDKVAGICLACSLNCHEGHDLIELYTKRNFRCDCGNSLFPESLKCKLEPIKCLQNDENKYNHNFSGTYCTCLRPYPDIEDSIEDSMIQCIICEDWFHSRHVTSHDINNINFEEMTCQKCFLEHDFLKSYIHICNAITDTTKLIVFGLSVKIKEDNETVTTATNDASTECLATVNVSSTTPSNTTSCLETPNATNEINNSPEKATFRSTTEEPIVKELFSSTNLLPNGEIKLAADSCILESSDMSLKSGMDEKVCALVENASFDTEWNGAVFWPVAWREKLCSCTSCLAMYERKNVSYLLKADDTLKTYESKCKSIDSIATEEINKLNHVQKIELVTGYMNLKNGLTEYLKKFENGKVVREEDIQEFFEGLQSNKKKKTD